MNSPLRLLVLVSMINPMSCVEQRDSTHLKARSKRSSKHAGEVIRARVARVDRKDQALFSPQSQNNIMANDSVCTWKQLSKSLGIVSVAAEVIMLPQLSLPPCIHYIEISTDRCERRYIFHQLFEKWHSRLSFSTASPLIQQNSIFVAITCHTREASQK